MALAKAKEIVSSNPVAVFRSVSLCPFSVFLHVCENGIHFSTNKSNVNGIVFVLNSKTYCPFCVSVKKLLSELGATFKAVELDTESTLYHYYWALNLCAIDSCWYTVLRN